MEALAQRMVLLVRDANLRHRMGERGRQLAQRFRVPVIADQYRQLYYQVAGKELP
jgi:glycosyltransferase involved in cell wall biosynthesis